MPNHPKVTQLLADMWSADGALYERILDTPTFGYLFNQLCLLAVEGAKHEPDQTPTSEARMEFTDEEIKQLEALGWGFYPYGPEEWGWRKIVDGFVVAVQGDTTWASEVMQLHRQLKK